jgi:hypothetical protein
MAPFKDLDWRRLDVTAIVAFGGLATVEPARQAVARDSLIRE